MGSISMGLPISYCSVTLPQIKNEFNLSQNENTWFNCGAMFFSAFGAILMGSIVNKIGKRWASFITGLISGLTFVGLGLSRRAYLVFLFRYLNGMTVGFISSYMPVFFQEIAPSHLKARFGFVAQTFVSTGFLTPTLMDYFADWRLNFFLLSIFPFLLMVFVWFVPEKPKPKTTEKIPYWKVFKYWRSLITALCLMFFLQFSGVGAIVSNMKTIIIDAGLAVNPTTMNVIANSIQIAATLLSSITVDRWGRKLVWTLSASMQLVAFLMLFGFMKFGLHPYVFIAGLCLDQFGYGFGCGPIPFMHLASLFPDEVRGYGVGSMTAVNWCLMATVNLIWPGLQSMLGLAWAFFFFACIFVLSIVFGLIALPTAAQMNLVKAESIQSLSSTPLISQIE